MIEFKNEHFDELIKRNYVQCANVECKKRVKDSFARDANLDLVCPSCFQDEMELQDITW